MLMNLAAIETLLNQRVGIDPNILGGRKIARAVETRLSICGLATLDAYLKLLQQSPQEFDDLMEQIVVPETWFFRDRKPFDFLIHYIRSEWLPKSGTAKLRVLSAPCSTGEEPYSIAIALLEAGLPASRFSIDAIDISHQAIAKAQRATYGKNSFRGEDWVERRRYFQPTATHEQLCASVRNTVNFRQGNLLDGFSMTQAKYDIVFCRNLLIYLDSSACTRVFDILDRGLLPQGLIFVGASETGKIPRDCFTSLRQPSTFAYQKIDVSRSQSPSVKMALPPELGQYASALLNQPLQNFVKSSSAIAKHPISPASAPSRSATPPASKPTSFMAQKVAPKPVNTPVGFSLELARQCADAGQVETALQHCKEYLDRDRLNAAAYTLLGTLYQAKAEPIQAEQYFRKALYLNPQDYEALMQLALLKEDQGDMAGASVLHQRIQKLQQAS